MVAAALETLPEQEEVQMTRRQDNQDVNQACPRLLQRTNQPTDVTKRLWQLLHEMGRARVRGHPSVDNCDPGSW